MQPERRAIAGRPLSPMSALSHSAPVVPTPALQKMVSCGFTQHDPT
jgi:hypothetical protein